jgi:hypothetical protein
MKEKKKILITVKTYPVSSKKYDELVCTAGITEDGKWIRLYPVEFRKLPYASQYKKYDLIEAKVEKRTKDFRKESFNPPVSQNTPPQNNRYRKSLSAPLHIPHCNHNVKCSHCSSFYNTFVKPAAPQSLRCSFLPPSTHRRAKVLNPPKN